MPRDSQGMPAHSFGRAKRQDESHQRGLQHASKVVDPKSRPAGHQPDPDAEMREESPEDIHDVVAEHGPAVELHTKHDHEAGIHQVTSHHGEHRAGHEEGSGFTHHSKHSDVHAAHKHMGHALGLGEGQEKETPEYESAEESAPTAAIPGMG
jgi:hypothetical protein